MEERERERMTVRLSDGQIGTEEGIIKPDEGNIMRNKAKFDH